MASKVTLRDAEALVGMPYQPRIFDCVHLAVLAQQHLWGRAVAGALPASHPAHPRAQRRLASAWRDELATRLPEGEAESGDVALFTHTEPGTEQWHIATLLQENGEQWLLHTHQGAGRSVLERLPDALRRGLKLEGFYRWKAQP